MKKVLLLQQTIPHYRVPILERVAARCALTAVYSEGEAPASTAFTALHIPRFKLPRVGTPYRVNLRRLARPYDVVIGSFDVDPLTRFQLERRPRPWGLVYWGIGVSASYKSHYDADREYDAFYLSVVNAADACLFYTDYPKEKYAAAGVPREKLFVAINTVEIPPVPEAEKDSVLFIGSLYRQKGLDALLDAYAGAVRQNASVPRLVLIGEGSERSAVEARVEALGIGGRVTLTGAIFDDALLAPYFARALACVSPGQAGLSVLKSMGCGVPYVTRKNAITGGEIQNIVPGVNGILYDEDAALTQIFLDMADDPGRFLALGREARRYYEQNCRPDQMAQGFYDAIAYAAGISSMQERP